MTQGDPLSPTILNILVDAVVRKWLLIVAEEAAGKDGFGR